MDRERLLIDHLRKRSKNQTLFYRLSGTYDYAISAITEFEFTVGSSPQNAQFIELLLSKIPVIAFDTFCVPVAAKIYRELRVTNQLISPPDIFIAATAIAHDLTLLTLNRRHFARIPDLRLHVER